MPSNEQALWLFAYTILKPAKLKAWLSCLLIKNFNHTPNHARVSISHAWYKCLSNALSHFGKYINYIKKPQLIREKKGPCQWLTFSEFSHFKRESNWRRGRVPLCFRVCVRWTSSKQLRNIFGNLCKVIGDLRILSDPYKKSWHSQDKNVMPINLTRLAGIHFAVGFSGCSTYLKGALTEGMRGHFYKIYICHLALSLNTCSYLLSSSLLHIFRDPIILIEEVTQSLEVKK